MADRDEIKNSLIAGSLSGFVADSILFPFDTVKSRLQSAEGFLKSGGFRHIYKGVTSFALGSLPNSAAFFATYEISKQLLPNYIPNQTAVYLMSSGMAELNALIIRVPFEVVKQRAQVYDHFNSRTAFRYTWRTEGLPGFYRGFTNNAMRDLPFGLCQMPLWEFFKMLLTKVKNSHSEKSTQEKIELTGFESGVCGSIATGIAGFVTTPLDVAKTRIMVADYLSPIAKMNPILVLLYIKKNKGIRGMFAGATPRVASNSLYGFFFLGAYDQLKLLINS